MHGAFSLPCDCGDSNLAIRYCEQVQAEHQQWVDVQVQKVSLWCHVLCNWYLIAVWPGQEYHIIQFPTEHAQSTERSRSPACGELSHTWHDRESSEAGIIRLGTQWNLILTHVCVCHSRYPCIHHLLQHPLGLVHESASLMEITPVDGRSRAQCIPWPIILDVVNISIVNVTLTCALSAHNSHPVVYRAWYRMLEFTEYVFEY